MNQPPYSSIFSSKERRHGESRAFAVEMLSKENGIVFNYYPKDMDTNAEEAKTIISKGFFLAFESLDQANTAEELLKSQPHIKNFEVIDAPKQEPPKPVEAPKPAPEGV